MIIRILSIALLLASTACLNDNGSRAEPRGLRETGYLTCEADEGCGDRLSCAVDDGRAECVDVPPECDGASDVRCACAEALCDGRTCADVDGGIRCGDGGQEGEGEEGEGEEGEGEEGEGEEGEGEEGEGEGEGEGEEGEGEEGEGEGEGDPPCDADAGCDDFEICDEGECRVGCRDDDACDDGEICDEGSCVPDGGGCPDADGDRRCDDVDNTCDSDGSRLACRRMAPPCPDGTVPEVRNACYTDRCLNWADCAAATACAPPPIDPCSHQSAASCDRCAVTVRLDHDSLDVLGWAARCIDEPEDWDVEAAAAAAGREGERDITVEGARGAYVLYQSPGDFGGVSVVSTRHMGHLHIADHSSDPTLFQGTIVWGGQGEVQWPANGDLRQDLGADDCAQVPLRSLFEHDLVLGEEVGRDALVPWEAGTKIRRTGLAHAVAAGGGTLRSQVLLYPRSVGVFNPATAEWVVILIADRR